MASTLGDLARGEHPDGGPLGAADTVQQVVHLAHVLLCDQEVHAGRSREKPSRAALERVARLRDELHVVANRVERFGVDADPHVDPVRIKAPIASSAVLGPDRILHQLNLSAGRLTGLLRDLSLEQWDRQGRVAHRAMTLGEVVEAVVEDAFDDLFDLLDGQDLRVRGGSASRS